MEDLFSKERLEELSEVSEEFDFGRWKTRIEGVMAALSGVASRRESLMAWLLVWLPAVMALQKLGMTLGKLVFALRKAIVEADDPDVFRADVLAELGEDFQALTEVFPDAGHWLLGVDELDRLIREVLEDPAARQTVSEVGSALTTLVDDVLARMVTVLMSPDKSVEVDVPGISHWIENLEAVVQAALDRLDLGSRLLQK